MIDRHHHNDTLPALGFGTWQLRGDECRRAVNLALETGYRHIDTARMYGNEKAIGDSITASGVNRDDLFLTTKVWRDNLRRQQVVDALNQSLDDLQTDYVNLTLIHWPNGDVPLEETLEALNELRREGKTRHIGVSNFSAALMRGAREISEAPIFCNQVEFHPYLGEKPIREACIAEDILLTAYSPIARGRVLQDSILQEIAGTHGKSPVQITLRWILQLGGTLAIPKAATPEHIRANFDLFDFELADVEMERINALDRNERFIDPDFAPDWTAV
jgi:diketogulonate reductase-like aldo/keto reductase